MEKYRMYINGEWVEAESGKYYDDINPYTGEVWAQIADGDQADIDKAIDAAAAAFPAWAATPPSQKRKLLYRVADIIERRSADLCKANAIECATCAAMCGFAAFSTPEYFREAASQVFMVHGSVIPTDTPDQLSMEWRQPLGVIGSITPWNVPTLLGARGIACPIAYGNTVVLKSSECSAYSGSIFLAECFDEAGFPAGVLNVITTGPGKSRLVGDAFTGDKRIKGMHFTGSTEVGRHLNMQCAEHFKKIALELGGDDPLVVLAGADLEYAASCATFGRFMHQGQVCMGTKRVVVEESIAEDLIARIVKHVTALGVGDPLDERNFVSALQNQNQIDECVKQVEHAKEQGAKVMCGGKKLEGFIYEPTVLVVTEDMDIAHEEVFGPVLKVLVAKDEDDAVRIANDTDYGLSSGVITGDGYQAIDIAKRIESGICHVNDCSLDDHPHAPFGGAKQSGIGNNGMETINEYTQCRWVTVKLKNTEYPV